MRAFEFEGEYFCTCAYHARYIPIRYGFQYNRKAEAWWTKDKSKYDKLLEFITAPDVVIDNQDEIIAKSRAADTDYSPPVPEGLAYRPFQRAGIEWSVERSGVLIADPMGLGKTIQAIGTCNAVNARRVLVICPNSLKMNWFEELRKWMVNKTLRYHVITTNTKNQITADVIIVNYDKLKTYAERFRQIEWDAIIIDEGHRIKNPRTNRTKYIVGGKVGKITYAPMTAKKKMILTGTPVLNKPDDIWSICHWLLPEVFHDEWDFWRRYCDLKPGFRGSWDHSGSSNLTELQKILRSTIMVRRDKLEVLKDLPEISRQVIEIEATAEFKKFIAEEQRVHAEAKAASRDLKQAVIDAEASGDKKKYNEAVSALKQGISLHISQISKVRKATAIAKTPMMIKYIHDVLENEPKIIVFCHHKEVIGLIKEEFKKKAVVVSGSVRVQDRDAAKKRFQEDPTCNIFIGSLYAAAEGLTLTASNTVIFAELDWVPATLMQAEARAWRIGQKRNVLVQHFVLEGSLDANMAKKVVDKQNMADAALDDELVQAELGKMVTL